MRLRLKLSEASMACIAVLLLVCSLGLWVGLALFPGPWGASGSPVISGPLGGTPPATSIANTVAAFAADSKRSVVDPFSNTDRAAARSATVRVMNVATGAAGSGVMIYCKDQEFYVLTADHVTTGGDRFEVSTFSVASYPNPADIFQSASLVASSAESDLSVLRVATHGPQVKTVRLCPPTLVPKGEFPVLTVGCEGGNAPTCITDKVLGKARVHKPRRAETPLCWITARAPTSGRSGGPLLDGQCRVIGVASGVGDDRGYYTHADEIHSFLTRNDLKWLYEGGPSEVGPKQ
jgi:S1-C subfamily serine protease